MEAMEKMGSTALLIVLWGILVGVDFLRHRLPCLLDLGLIELCVAIHHEWLLHNEWEWA